MTQKGISRFWHKAGPWQVLLEACLLWGIGLVVIAASVASQQHDYDPSPLLQFFMLTGSLWPTLRLRWLQRGWLQALGSDLVFAALLVLLTAVEGEVMGIWLEPAFSSSDLLNGYHWVTSLCVCLGLFFLVARLVLAVWYFWRPLTRQKLVWSITQAQISLLMRIAVFINVAWLLVGYVNNYSIRVKKGVSLQQALIDTTAGVIGLGSMYGIAISVVVFLIVLPFAGIAAYGVARRITRRLDALASSASALRQGDYTARVEVSGEDEVAHLQDDFNAMATDLERTLHDLQAERDRVAGLLQSRRELIANVSHDLRTPVATVRAYLDAARKNWQQVPSAANHDLDIMEREIIRLQGLIDDLFTLSQAEVDRLTFRIEPGDVGPIVEQCVDAMAPFAWQSGRVAVDAQVPPSLPLAQFDAGRLQQVIVNLLRNAIRHTPPGGIVAVVVADMDACLRIEVRDTGAGIDPEDLPHIWERFYQGKGARQAEPGSAGLGLALVKELTEAMGGSVAVESTPGRGSCFSIELPLVH